MRELWHDARVGLIGAAVTFGLVGWAYLSWRDTAFFQQVFVWIAGYFALCGVLFLVGTFKTLLEARGFMRKQLAARHKRRAMLEAEFKE